MDDRAAFIEAITKLADDEAFRRSFMEHYQIWLHPPMFVVGSAPDLSEFDLRPGAINWVDDVGVFTRRRFSDDVDPASRDIRPGTLPPVMWCPDTNTMPIEGVEIAPRPVMQAENGSMYLDGWLNQNIGRPINSLVVN